MFREIVPFCQSFKLPERCDAINLVGGAFTLFSGIPPFRGKQLCVILQPWPAPPEGGSIVKQLSNNRHACAAVDAQITAEERFREAEQRYRTLFRQSPDGVLIIDPVSRLPIDFNDVACRELGYRRQQFRNVPVEQYEIDMNGDEIQSHIQTVLNEGQDRFMTRHLTSRGDVRDVLVMIRTIKVGGQKALHCVYRDMTKRKRAESLSRSLVNINTAVNSTLDLEEITRIAVTEAARALQAEAAQLGIRDGDKWVTRYVHGRSAARMHDYFTSTNARMADEVAETRSPLVITDACDAGTENYAEFCEDGVKSLLAVPLILKDEVVGIISFSYRTSPLYFGKDLLDFCSGLATAVSLAMENARLFQNELEARKSLEEHARRMAILHRLSLMLNSETALPRLFQMILEAAATVTGAGVGVMTRVNENRTSVIAEYYAPWYQSGCATSERNVSQLHHRIVRLVGPVRDAVRIGDLDQLERPLDFPAGHPELSGLLVGTIRDPRGQTRGHFMLSCKSGGKEFTAADEEIVSLLAAQSSVALTSAENLKREKVVTDALQSSLLSNAPERDDLEIGFIYQSPSSEGRVGGDFYDFHPLSDGGLAIAVGDVCGKGLQAATYTSMVKYMLRAYLGEGYEPGECLTRLNRALAGELGTDIFVTLFLGLVDAGRHKIRYASAGHPSPLVCCPTKEAIAIDLSPGLPLGVSDDYSFLTHERALDSQSTTVMYTDGLMDARPDGGEPYGMRRLSQAIGRYDGPPQKLAEMLLDGAMAYAGGILRDDIAIVAVRIP